jgi:prepilin peptidase CpaA
MQFLTPTLIAYGVNTVLCALIISAAWSDVKSRRIPNQIVFIGALTGLLFNFLLPPGNGFISSLPGAIGLTDAFSGLGLGLIILMPLYVLRGMGAGDVKLVAMIGAFLGPQAIIKVVLLTFMVGGIFSIALAFRQRTLNRLFSNVKTMIYIAGFKLALHETPKLEESFVSAGKLPYAVSIAIGTFSYMSIVYINPDF